MGGNPEPKLLKADHLQAMIVCHQDTKHPHVHVIVNRVDPTTGKMHPFGNDAHKLDEWAAKYERDRHQIVSPNRDRKDQARQQRQAEARIKPVFAKSANPTPPAPKPVPTPAALLAEEQAMQKARHKQEWEDLSTAHKARRGLWGGSRINIEIHG